MRRTNRAADGFFAYSRRVGEQVAQVAVVEVGVIEAVVLALLAGSARRASCGAAAADRPRAFDFTRRPRARQLAHQPIHVFELALRRPSGVPRRPHRVRVEPHGEGLGEVLVGMALRVPVIEMLDEALAVRLRRVVLGIRRRRACRTAGAASAAGAADTRCRWRGPLRGAESSGTTSGSPPSTSSICASSSLASRGCAR